MADETKRPTAQDIETIRAMLVTHLMAAVEKDPDTVRQVARLLDTGDRVLDYAAACVEAEAIGADWGNLARLRADRAGETPTPPTLADLVAQRDSVDQQIRTLYPEADGERVPEVEAPEDAGECPCAGGCGAMLDPPFAPGDVCDLCSAVDQFMAGRQPPTGPEARVRAMSDEEVEAALTEHGVGPWVKMLSESPHMHRSNGYGWTVISQDGGLWQKGHSLRTGGGDTTTPEGRAECSRRLLVHLLREEVERG